ncbi:zinc finger protein 624-like [Macrobrachium rosenbergii]|uniref:zinc finger protein 624-like n=1 Tax=Macrobrachium rosenbergii TaxID=79674 RepID=UPI0034D6A3EA
MICDICGNCHATGKCHLVSLHSPKGWNDVHLAYKSLPSWVQVNQRPGGKASVITQRHLPEGTKLGPLLAPQVPSLVSNNLFPLKVFHNSGGVTYFDLSRKQYCNWLSLIPQGTADNRNLLVCQIDDFLYYFAVEDITEKTELRVWYAPFYHEKILDELRLLKGEKSLKIIPINKPDTDYSATAEPELRAPSSLTQISVGRGEITFTHNICHDDSNNEVPPATTLPPTVASGSDSSIWDGYIQAAGVSCRYVNKDQILERQDYFRKPMESMPGGDIRPSIEIMTEKVNPRVPEKVVTFTINAVTRGQASGRYLGEHTLAGELSMGELSDEDGDRNTFPTVSKRKPYKLKKFKKNVVTAKSDVVKRLPPRALGVSFPCPWTCRYCGEDFSKPLLFANHVKAHLRWIIYQRHKSDGCGKSLQESTSPQDHQNTPLKDKETLSSLSLENKNKVGISVKNEVLSEEEVMDVESSGNGQFPKKKVVLSTNVVDGPHNCQICPTQFHKPEYLLRHLRKHTGDFTCEKCLKVFARKEGLQKHVCPGGLHKKTLECSICSRSFLSEALLQKHELKHKGSRKCTLCDRFYSSKESLEKHMKNCPTVEITTSYKCGVCSKEFINQSFLDRHINSHSRQYQCEICSKTYATNASLKQHVQLCRQIQQVVSYGHVKCEECGEVFTGTAEFRTHYQKHTHPFNCKGCDQRFKTRVGYEIHVCRVELTCDHCGAEFRSVQALNRHAAVHGPPPFTCMSCRRSFYRKESLDRHNCCSEEEIQEVPQSKGNFNFKCNICGVILSTRHSFNTHMKSAHGGLAAKEFGCGVCGKQFSRKDLLREHSMVHTAPSLPCPECKKLFKTQKSLEVHKLIHQGIKRFVCKYCGKKYHQKVNLAKHERSHLPRGAVKCQCCGIQFYSTDDLKAHLLSHTFVQPELSQKLEKESELLTSKETFHIDGSQLCTSASDIKSQQTLKIKPLVCSDIPAERIFTDASNALQSENNLQLSPNRTCVVVESGMKAGHSLGPEFRTDLFHVTDITRQGTKEHSAIGHTQVGKSKVAFVTQDVTNVCIPASRESFDEKVSTQSEHKLSRDAQNITAFQSESNTYNEICSVTEDIPGNSATDMTVSGGMHTYHLNLDDNCQVTVEKGHGNFDQSSYVTFEDGNDKSISLKANSLIEGTESMASPVAKSIGYIVDQQITESVVIVTNNPEEG